MIKILFDHQIFSEQRFGGISRYFANLVLGINRKPGLNAEIAVRYSKNYYLGSYPQIFDNLFGRWLLRKDGKRYRWNRKYSEKLLKKGDYDVFHATYYDNYSLAFNKKPMVITVHDMIHENNPEMFSNAAEIIAQKKNMMEAATAIIAISNFTSSEIIKFYPRYAKKITVVYHGLPMRKLMQVEKGVVLPKRFILFVGERGNYKNFKIFAKAIAPLLLEDGELKLICAGGKDFSTEEMRWLEEHKIKEECMQLHATDGVLQQLYQNALLFAYPSSQEGFGLPILEAFQFNCPIACSNLSCLPEIGGDAVAYFDPNDIESILGIVKKIIDEPTYAQELKVKGKERLKDFSIEVCVENTIKIYQALLK